jgi:nucleoside-diphosphate kinase
MFMYQETLIILKPDALERNLVGASIKYYEDAGLKIMKLRFVDKVRRSLLEEHYPDSMALSIGKKAQLAVPDINDPEVHGLKVLNKLRSYLSRGPVIAIMFSGENAIDEARKVTGYTDPAIAEKGTVRGDLGVDSIIKSTDEGRAVENLVHASGNVSEAHAELKLWLP